MMTDQDILELIAYYGRTSSIEDLTTLARAVEKEVRKECLLVVQRHQYRSLIENVEGDLVGRFSLKMLDVLGE